MSIRRLVAVLAAVLVLAACAAPEDVPAATAAEVASADAPSAMTMYRSPDCDCCHLWADIARQAGWSVASADKLDITAFKAEVGVPPEYASCHTTIVAGYFVEGHVPLEAIEKLLAEHPEIDGIALPGMPPGSPGMSGQRAGPLEVLAIAGGVAAPFGSY